MAQQDWRNVFWSARTQVRSLAQHSGLRILALPQLWLRSQLRLRSDPWPRNSKCHGAAKKEKKKSMRRLIMYKCMYHCVCVCVCVCVRERERERNKQNPSL